MDRAIFVLAILLLNFLVASCSVKPEEPGLCALKCGGAIIGANDPNFVIEPLNDDAKISCQKGTGQVTEAAPVGVKFLVSELVEGGTSSKPIKKPVPYISIEPIVVGTMADVYPGNDQVLKEEGRYRGVLTGRENWCSDSCGVVSLLVVPSCMPDPGAINTVTVQVSTGALTSESVTIDAETPAETTSSTTTNGSSSGSGTTP